MCFFFCSCWSHVILWVCVCLCSVNCVWTVCKLCVCGLQQLWDWRGSSRCFYFIYFLLLPATRPGDSNNNVGWPLQRSQRSQSSWTLTLRRQRRRWRRFLMCCVSLKWSDWGNRVDASTLLMWIKSLPQIHGFFSGYKMRALSLSCCRCKL